MLGKHCYYFINTAMNSTFTEIKVRLLKLHYVTLWSAFGCAFKPTIKTQTKV